MNTIASIFDAGSSVGSAVTDGVTVACTAGQIVQVAAGARRKRGEGYRRAAEAEAEADEEEGREMLLRGRWVEGWEE